MLQVAYVLAAVICTVIGVLAWRKRDATVAAPALAAAMAGITWWTLVDLVVSFADDHERVRDLWVLVLPGVGLAIAAFYCLCRGLADRDWRPTRRLLALLTVEPVLITLAAFSNPWHELVVGPVQPGDDHLTYGVLFWVHTAYSYALLTSALAVVVRQRRFAPALQNRQLTTLLAGAVVPVIGNVITLTGQTGFTDLSGIFFVGTGLLDAHAVLRQGLFEVVPVARARVLERLQDAVVVLDERDRLSDLNAAALALLARGNPEVPAVGMPAREALGPFAALLDDDGQRRVDLPGGAVDLDVQATTLLDRRGRLVGRTLVVRDVTEPTRVARDLRRANAALRQQLATIERLRCELQEQALRDPLTGLHNRRHLGAVLGEMTAAAVRDGTALAVALLDVDHFKAVNDQHGHAAGDELLAALGAQLQTAVRDGDVVARYGGEEFVVVLPALGLEEAVRRCEQIRAVCAGIELAKSGAHVTVSAGVACVGPARETADALLEAADRALYAAKAAGRNRTVAAEPLPQAA